MTGRVGGRFRAGGVLLRAHRFHDALVRARREPVDPRSVVTRRSRRFAATKWWLVETHYSNSPGRHTTAIRSAIRISPPTLKPKAKIRPTPTANRNKRAFRVTPIPNRLLSPLHSRSDDVASSPTNFAPQLLHVARLASERASHDLHRRHCGFSARTSARLAPERFHASIAST